MVRVNVPININDELEESEYESIIPSNFHQINHIELKDFQQISMNDLDKIFWKFSPKTLSGIDGICESISILPKRD